MTEKRKNELWDMLCETRSKRFQMLIPPRFFKEVKREAENWNLSTSTYLLYGAYHLMQDTEVSDRALNAKDELRMVSYYAGEIIDRWDAERKNHNEISEAEMIEAIDKIKKSLDKAEHIMRRNF